jgi:hypothetical protein
MPNRGDYRSYHADPPTRRRAASVLARDLELFDYAF